MEGNAMRRLLAICFLCSLGTVHADGDILWVASAIASAQGKTASALEEVAAPIRKDYGLDALSLEKEKKWDIQVGGGNTFEFENGYTLRIDCQSMDTTRYLFSVALADPHGPLLTTKVEAAKRMPLILAGPEKDGRRQLFVILVR